MRSNESPGGAFKRRAVCVSRWRGLALTSSAGRDKREIKNLDSAEYSQSESGGYLKSKKGYTPSLKISIPRFLPVENSLRICYDKKQRYSHKMLTKLSDTKLDKEINYTKELLSNMTGTDVSLVRPPYGEINNRIKKKYDVPYILWSIDTKDWKLKDANKIYEKVINEVSDGDIILMHETYLSSVTALDMIIPKLQEMGYQIVTVSELANLKNVKLENGVVYHSFK